MPKNKRVKKYNSQVTFLAEYDMWETLCKKANELNISVAELMRRVTVEQMKAWEKASKK